MARSPSSTTARSTTIATCGPSWRPAGISSAVPRTQRCWCTSTRTTALAWPNRSAAVSPSPSTTAADVPVAALLSGGIDSSLVVAAHGRATAGSTATFNVRFPTASHDETAVALAVAEHCHTAHRTIDLRDENMSSEAILDLLRHFDQPFADMSLLPMYWISRAIRDQGIICALSGDGGDEAFGGYPRFWRADRLFQLMQLPSWMGGALRVGGGALA